MTRCGWGYPHPLHRGLSPGSMVRADLAGGRGLVWWHRPLWEGGRMATAFSDALTSAQTAVTGYLGDALPVVAAIAVAFLGVKYARRIIKSL